MVKHSGSHFHPSGIKPTSHSEIHLQTHGNDELKTGSYAEFNKNDQSYFSDGTNLNYHPEKSINPTEIYSFDEEKLKVLGESSPSMNYLYMNGKKDAVYYYHYPEARSLERQPKSLSPQSLASSYMEKSKTRNFNNYPHSLATSFNSKENLSLENNAFSKMLGDVSRYISLRNPEVKMVEFGVVDNNYKTTNYPVENIDLPQQVILRMFLK